MASASDHSLALTRLRQLSERAQTLLAQRDELDPDLDQTCRELARLQRELAGLVPDLHEAQVATLRAEARVGQLSRKLAEDDTTDDVLIVIPSDAPDPVGEPAPSSARRPATGPERIPAFLTWGRGVWNWCAIGQQGCAIQQLDGTQVAAWPSGQTRAEVLVQPDGYWATWQDAAGTGYLGRPSGHVEVLGPAVGRPALMRGSGDLPVSVAWSSPDGLVYIRRPDGDSEELTTGRGGPRAAGAVAAWWWDYEGSRHVVYRDAAGGINEFLELDGIWYHASLHVQTGCPPAVGDPIGYAPGDHEHVLFRSGDGHIHELCFDGRRWRDHDLTSASGAPSASGQPVGAYVGGRHFVAHRADDGQLCLLRLRKDWRCRSLPALGPASGDPILGTAGRHGALAWPVGSAWNWCVFVDEAAVEAPETLR
jgi:hypothetical protein